MDDKYSFWSDIDYNGICMDWPNGDEPGRRVKPKRVSLLCLLQFTQLVVFWIEFCSAIFCRTQFYGKNNSQANCFYK